MPNHTWAKAAEIALRKHGTPMTVPEILAAIKQFQLRTISGERPEQTLHTEIYRHARGREDMAKHTRKQIFFEPWPHSWALIEWEAKADRGGAAARPGGSARAAAAAASVPAPVAERAAAEIAEPPAPPIPEENDEQTFPEGRERFQMHRSRERNTQLIKRAKRARLAQDPLLRCQICGFSFLETYGEQGDGFIEAHHVLPLSELDGETETRLEDIVLICSNCHRMIHRRRPWLTIESIKELLR